MDSAANNTNPHRAAGAKEPIMASATTTTAIVSFTIGCLLAIALPNGEVASQIVTRSDDTIAIVAERDSDRAGFLTLTTITGAEIDVRENAIIWRKVYGG